MKTFVHLGRYGDVINTLPLLKHFADNGEAVRLVIADKYADVLEGVSYVKPLVHRGAFEDLRVALEHAHALDPHAINLQVYGRDMPMQRHTESFVKEQWHRAGMAQAWGSLPLVFDQRSAQREATLITHVAAKKPMVLVAVEGNSSPFAHGAALLTMLRERFEDRATVVDLSNVKAERIYDLLGLFDEAACLITIDTMHMHLAQGSKVPVIALATDGPTPWHSSARRPGQVWYGKYSAFRARAEEMMAMVDELIGGTRSSVDKGRTTPALGHSTLPGVTIKERTGVERVRSSGSPLRKERGEPRIVHVYSFHPMMGDALRRHTAAVRSWERVYTDQWQPLPVRGDQLPRTALDLGHDRDLPFVKDLLAFAIRGEHAEHDRALGENDIVVLSNSDACMATHIGEEILHMAREHGAFYTHRWDFDHPVDAVTNATIRFGKWYPGSDLFGFTVKWWKAHAAEYPDMLLGAEYVDAVLRQLIKKYCGTGAEIHQAVYHQKHANEWSRNRMSRANLHNAHLARKWFEQHGCDDLDPFGEQQRQQIRSKRGVPLFQHA